MALSAGNLNQGNAANPLGNPLGELPPLPPPSSLLMNGPVDVIVPKGMPGQPANGPVIIRPTGGQGLNSGVQPIYSGIPSTQVPTSSIYTPPTIPDSVDIPAPHLAAPWVYHNGNNLQQSGQQNFASPYGANGMGGPNAANQFNNNQNTFYNAYGQPVSAPPYMMPQQGYQPQPAQQQPQQPVTPPAPPEAPKQPEQPKPPEPPKDAAKDDPAKKEEPKKPEPDPGSFNEDVIKRLNDMLNNANESVRADAAIDFFKILSGNPSLAEDPLYKKYVDAFLTKILQDPSAVVRQGGMLAMETGLVKQPNSKVRGVLEDLSKRSGLFDIESSAAQDILGSILPEAPETEDTHGHNNSRAGNLRKNNPHFGNPAKAPEKTAPASEPASSSPASETTAEGSTPTAGTPEAAVTQANQEAAQQTSPEGNTDSNPLDNPNLPPLDPNIMAQLASLGGNNAGLAGLPDMSATLPANTPGFPTPQAAQPIAPATAQTPGQRLNMVSPGLSNPGAPQSASSMQRPVNFPVAGGQRYA